MHIEKKNIVRAMFSFYQIFTYLMILVFIYLFFTKTNVSLAFFSLTVIL